MILTSNRDIGEWPEVFVDPVLASAAIDRIFDRAKVAVFKGKSYRAEGKEKVRVVKKKELAVYLNRGGDLRWNLGGNHQVGNDNQIQHLTL